MKTLGTLVVAFLALTFLSAPSFAAKKALNQGDLDRITAAGEPTVIQLDGVTALTSDVNVTLDAIPTVDDASTQTGLKALSLNNVIGENQMANGLNVQSVTAANPIGSNQTNTVLQSWGSIKVTDWASTTSEEPGVTTGGDSTSTSAESSAGAGNVVADRGGAATIGDHASNKCIGLNNCQGASSSSSSSAAAANGEATGAISNLAMAPIFETADVIVDLTDVQGANVNVDVEDMPVTTFEANQTDLLALALNNVVGMSQVANGTNIEGGAISLDTTTGLSIAGSGSNGASIQPVQSNDISQYRGTPTGITLAPVTLTAIGAVSTTVDTSSSATAVAAAP